MPEKKVTVIVPVAGAQGALGQTLDALAGQYLFEHMEVIAVCTDDSAASKLAERFAQAHPGQVRALQAQGAGTAAALNAGLAAATGTYVGFAGCADVPELRMYQRLYEQASTRDADVCVCGYFEVREGTLHRRGHEPRPCFGHNLRQAPNLIRRTTPHVFDKLFRRSFIEANALRFDEDLPAHADFLFTYTSYLFANRVEQVPEALTSHVLEGPQVGTPAFGPEQLALLAAFRRLVQRYEQHNALLMAEDELLCAVLEALTAALALPCANAAQCKQAWQLYRQGTALLDERFFWWKTLGASFGTAGAAAQRLKNAPRMWGHVFAGQSAPVQGARQLRGRLDLAPADKARAAFVKALAAEPASADAVLLDSCHGTRLSNTILQLLAEVLRSPHYQGLACALTYAKERQLQTLPPRLEAAGIEPARVELVLYGSPRHSELLASARYVFADSTLPSYYVKPSGQVLVYAWRYSPLEAAGRDRAEGFHHDGNITRSLLAADYVVQQSGPIAQQVARSFMTEGLAGNTTLLAGRPGNQVLFDAPAHAALRAELRAGGKQVVAFVPKWRGGCGAEPRLFAFLQQLDAQLAGKQLLLVSLPAESDALISYGLLKHIRPFPKGRSRHEVLGACDALVTDYSDVLLDFAATRRKAVLLRGHEEQAQPPATYVDLEALGLPVAHTAEQLAAELSVPADAQVAGQLAERFCPHDSASSAQRVCTVAATGTAQGVVKLTATSQAEQATLVFTNDLAAPATTKLLFDALDALGDAQHVVLAFNQDQLRNPELLQGLGPNVGWLGSSYAFSATTARERQLLRALAQAGANSTAHRAQLEAIAVREWRCAFPTLRFGRVVAFGSDQPRKLLLAACAPGESMLVLSGDEGGQLAQVPTWLLAKFGCICGTQASLAALPAGLHNTRVCAQDTLGTVLFE